MSILVSVLKHFLMEMAPGMIFGLIAIIPFAILEQLRPANARPSVREYARNLLISYSGLALSYPFGVLAGLCSARLREQLPWGTVSVSFSSLASVPDTGPALEIIAMIFVPLFIHDCWFYWAHRLEHKVPLLWGFHRIHHSDENMNTSTWARDHFLQSAFRAFFPIFTLGLYIDLDLKDSGNAALFSSLFLAVWSMFYHSAIRIELPWIDKVLVTPQLHRIHHSIDPAHHNRNFADLFPLFDIAFGTFLKPQRHSWPRTGLGEQYPAPRSWWMAQVAPLADLVLPGRRRDVQ